MFLAYSNGFHMKFSGWRMLQTYSRPFALAVAGLLQRKPDFDPSHIMWDGLCGHRGTRKDFLPALRLPYH